MDDGLFLLFIKQFSSSLSLISATFYTIADNWYKARSQNRVNSNMV